MKLYLVYYSNYEEVVRDGAEAVKFLGLYRSKEKAMQKAYDQIKIVMENPNMVMDNERDDLERDNYVRFFYDHQENWDYYFEISVSEMEVDLSEY